MTSADKLKIGLDFHGVITDNPEYFKVFANEALRRGYEIHIISGGPKATIEKFLQQWGIKYTDIFAIVDYYDARGCVTFYENGEFKVPDKLWNCAKAAYCDENGINIHIDDTMSYSEGFTTPFCFYDVKPDIAARLIRRLLTWRFRPKQPWMILKLLYAKTGKSDFAAACLPDIKNPG